MNKIYKVIFNRNKNRYEIVSELASSRGGKCKVKAGKQIAKLFMTGLLATFLSSVALAAEQEVVVKYDDATGTIKIVKKEDESQVLASYAVGGSMTPIIDNGNSTAKNVIALGKNSTVLQNNTIAIGTDAHAGNANGSVTQNDGKIAIGNKTVASGDRSIALGNKSNTNDGSYNIAQGNDSISIGTSTSVFGYSGVSIGRRNIIGVPDPNSIDVTTGKLTTKSSTPYKEADPGGNSVIVGAYNVAYGSRSNVVGTFSRAMGSNSVAIGSGVQSLTDGAIAIGKGSGYEFEDGSRHKSRKEKEFYGRDWELPPEYKVLKQVLSTDIAGDEQYKGKTGFRWEKGGTLPKYNNYGAGSSDPGGFIVEGKNALGVGSYTQVRGDSAIGLATGEMTADLSLKDKSAYAMAMGQIMGMEEALYEAKEKLEKLKAEAGDTTKAESAVKAAEERLATAKKEFRKNYLSEYSFVEGEAALGVGRKILAQGDRSMAVGDQAKAISNDAIAYGGNTLANGTNSMAMGGNAHVGTTEKAFDNSMAIGSHTDVQAKNAVALGAFSKVTGENSLALGFGKQSGDDINYNAVSGKNSTLIGSYGTVKGNNSILIGSSGSIANDRVVGLGNNINIEAADSNDQENNTAGSVFLGDHAGYVKDSKRARSLGKVTLVGSKEEKELTESLSSTKGALRDYTEDFIYIYMLERQDDGTQIGAPIAVRSDFAGGDSTVGVVSVGSTYEQTFENLDKIKEHHKKVGSLITVPVEVTVQVTKNGISLGEQQQIRYFAADAKEEDIKNDSTLSDEDKKKVWDTIQESRKKADTKYTVFETRRIQNVAPGLIGVNSTDAINGSQLFATNQMLGNLVGSLKKTFGDNVTITEDGQINVSGGGTLGWIAKAKAADGGTVDYQVGKDDKITKDNLKEKGSAIEAADQLVFQAGKNIGLVQTPDTLTISTIDTPSFKSVELRGDEKTVDGKKVTEVTKIDSSGMKVVTETSTPASDGSTTPTVTEKVSTTVGKDGVSTDGSVKVTNGTTDLVTIDKGTDDTGTDQEYGKIGLDGKNGSNATITVDRGTSSLDDKKNIGGTDPKQDINENNPAKMDRITYTTKNKDDKDVTHEVATMDDGLFFSGDSADGKEYNGATNTKNTFGRKLSEEAKIVGGVTTPANLTDNNIGVVSNGSDTLTIKLAKQLTGLDSATYTSPTTKTDDGEATSTMKVDGNGVRFVDNNGDTVNNTPTFTTDGITGGNKTITDVASGIGGEVKDPSHNNANTFLENVNKIGKKDGDQPAADAISENVVVNAKDLKNLVDTGFKLNTSGQGTAGASTVKIGDTINIIDGANTKVSAIDDSTTGTHTFHIDVTGMPISYTDNQGNALTKIGDKYYKNTDIENGKPKTNATEVPADEVTNNIKVINKDGTTNNQGTISNVKSVFDSNIGNGADTGSKVDEIKDGSVISSTGSNQFINDLTKLNDQVDPKATNAEAEKIRAKKDEEKLNSVSTVRDLQKVALTPLFFEGDVAQDAQTANTFDRKLSEKTKIVGGQKDVNQLTDNNIGVVSNGTDTLTIKLAKELQNLTSVTTGSGDNTTVMNQDGVTITTQTPKNGDKPASTTETKLSKDGLATDGTIKVIGDNAKDLVTIGKGTETDPNATDKEFGTVAIDGKNGSKATLTVDRGTKSVTDSANVGKDPTKPIDKDNPAAGMDRLTYTTTTGIGDKTIEIEHQVATLDDGFFLTTEHTEADKTRTVLFNNTIKVLDGANTKVSAMGGEDGTHTFSIDVTGLPMTYTATDANGKTQDVHKVGDTYTLADGTKLVQVRDKFYKPDQVEEVNGTLQVKADQEDKDTKLNNISLTSPVANTAPTLSNVGSALKKSDGTRITMSDLDDSSVYPTNNPIWNNAVNVGDLKAATDAARTEVTGTGKAIVTKKTGDQGQNIYNVHVDPIVDVVGADGSKVVRGDDGKYYNPTDIANKTYIPNADGNGGNWYDNGDLTNGVPNQGAKPQNVTPTDVKNNFVNPNGTDSIVLDNVKSGIGGEVKDAAGKNTFIDNINKVGKKNPDGTVAPDAISENTVVNAKDLKNVVDTGFKLNTSGHSGNAQTVKIGETIKVVDGANTKVSDITPKDGVHEFHIDVTGLPMTYTVSQTGGTDAPVSVSKVGDTYQLADGTKLVKVGDKFYKPSQLVNPKADQPEVKPDEVAKDWSVNDSVSLVNKDGSTNAPTLKNVGSGLKDANGNSTTLDQAVGSNAVNVDDLRTMGKAATTEVTGTGAAEVTKVTGADGQNIYNVHVDKLMTVKPVDPKANITRGGDGKYYNKDDIAGKTFVSDGNGGGSWYNASDVDAKTGKPLAGKSALDKQPIALDQSKLKNSVVNPNGDGATIVDNVKSGIGGEVKDTSGKNTFIDNINKVGKKNDDGTVAPDAISENTVVNAGDLKNLADTPLFFSGDAADGKEYNGTKNAKNTFGRKLSEEAKIVGGVTTPANLTDNNIGVVSNGSDTLTVKLAKELTNLTSVTTVDETNGTKTTVSGKGITTDGKVVVNNGKTGDEAKEFVTIDKGTDGSGTDKEYGKIGLDGKNGSNATITIDRGTKSLNDDVNIGVDPSQPVSETNKSATMDRITYTTTGPNKTVINHEVATLDDGFFLTTEHTKADETRTVLFNHTIKVLDGANTKVSAMGGEDGTHTFSIDVTGLPVTYTATKTDANGTPTGKPVDVSKVGDGYQLADGTKLVKVGDKYYTPDQLENGKPKPNVEGLTIKESVSLTQDNSAPATLERVGSGRRNGMKADADPMVWDKILNPSAEDKAKVDNMLTNAANIGDVRDAIKSITDGTSDNASGGFGLTGNNGDVKQDLGKTITVKGGIANKVDKAGQDLHVPAKSTTDKNTYVNVKDVPNADGKGSHKEMVIEIAKDLTDLDSVTVGSVDKDGKGETTKITGKDVTIKDKDGNTNKSTASNNELTNADGDKTTVKAGKVDVSKKNTDGTTSNTNIDGSKITLENKDKDSNTVGSKTDIGTDGIKITYKDDKGNVDPKKDVSLTDKGLNNGGNQIKNVGSGLVYKDGSKITDIAGITDQDILSNGVNVGDLQKAINSVTNSSNGGGFGLTGNNGKIMQDLGKTITIKGGIDNKMDDSGKDLPAKSTTAQNTYVNVKDSEMVVEIAKDLTDLDSVTIGNVDEKGNGGTVINKDSMTVKDKDGKNSTNIGAGTIGTSKTDGNGNTSSTNINGSHMTLENKDKNGKLTGPKTEVSNKGITITPVDKDGNPIGGKKVELSDTGLDNGGNQIKHVDSGLKKENGDSVKLEDATGDMLNNAVNVGDLQSVNKKLKDDIINISNQVDDIKNSAPVVYTDENGKRVSKQGDKFVNEDGKPVQPHEIKLSLVNKDGKSTTNPSTLQNVAKGVNKTDAVNVEQLKEATQKPITFNGDAGSSSAKLGETVAIKGGANSADLTNNNIGVIADSTTKTLKVKLSKKLKGLESAEFVDNNGNTTNITGDGVHISGGNGSNVSLTSQGLNNGGNRITNVAPGVEATDAVNVSQLNQVGAALHNRINNVAKGAYGGVASAGAMASLPQAYLPGKSMVAAGASHYRGESAVALGASRISDNGKIILKLNASHNTSGNTMVGAGVGYQF